MILHRPEQAARWIPFLFLIVWIQGCSISDPPPPEDHERAIEVVEFDHSLTLQQELPLQAHDASLQDATGRTIQLRGVNIRTVDGRTGNRMELSKEDLNWLTSRGVNTVRLHLYWNRLQPGPDSWNSAYQQGVRTIIDQLAEASFHVVLAFSPVDPTRYQSGNWLPGWVRKRMKKGKHLQSRVASQVDSFWNQKRIQKQYLKAIQRCLSPFNQQNQVVGYNVLNRPLTGSFSAKEIAEKPFPNLLKRAGSTLEENLKKKLLFVSFPVLGLAEPVHPVKGLRDLKKSGVNPVIELVRFHPFLRLQGTYTGYLQKKVRDFLKDFGKKLEETNLPVLLSEAGARVPMERGKHYLDDLLRWGGREFNGWCVWLYAPGRNEYSIVSSSRTDLWQVKVMNQPYPVAVPGELKRFQGGSKEDPSRIQISYRFDPATGGPLEIYLPERMITRRKMPTVKASGARFIGTYLPEQQRLLFRPRTEKSDQNGDSSIHELAITFP